MIPAIAFLKSQFLRRPHIPEHISLFTGAGIIVACFIARTSSNARPPIAFIKL
jgi:hypothetical protein